MAVSDVTRVIRAPRGATLSCIGWQQEAALRLLMNSVDPAVAEHPQELIVSGGIGKLARDWQAFHAIAESLRALHHDETLVVYDGEPGPVLKTNPDVPRVLVANSVVPPESSMFVSNRYVHPPLGAPDRNQSIVVEFEIAAELRNVVWLLVTDSPVVWPRPRSQSECPPPMSPARSPSN